MDSPANGYGIDAAAPWARLLENAARFVLRIVENHSRAQSAKATRDALQRLSPRELADIGLTRADVDLLAR